MNRMKERTMRWVSAILLIVLLILGMASPALAAARYRILLIIRSFLSPLTRCPSICPNRMIRCRARLVMAFCLLGSLVSPALAADYDLPILRGSAQPPAPVLSVGPATFTRWSGFYFGGDIGVSSAYSDFSKATQPLVQLSLQHTTVESSDHPSDFQVLGKGSAVGAGGGAFLGYNTQWQDLVLGVEATYTHVNLNTTASTVPNGVSRFFPDVSTGVAVAASGNLDLTDYGTARGRAGYVVGNLLPYGFLGMAVGRASYSVNTASLVQQTSNNVVQTFLFTNGAGQTNALLWGYRRRT
jgi:outer membrane immunogenic protein